ncbi:hypothetical protein AB1L42_07695 [Thalassoglobus sp. JC818]|uniref:hypothetical protein n=1 Tax=Thalassoglobus sp. JC818 TaxID=3232136 RepID=UPI003458885A
MAKKAAKSEQDDMDFSIGLPASGSSEVITARKAGGISDLQLSISPRTTKPAIALRNLAKAINVALKMDFIETDLDWVYKVARVRKGQLHIIHKDYIGLGDGIFASFGKAIRSFRLTLAGPDAASPEGKEWITKHGKAPLSGMISLVGRKLDLLQEFEDMAPLYVQQTLDRLEAKRIIKDWHRNEWQIKTTVIGLDVILTPLAEDEDEE